MIHSRTSDPTAAKPERVPSHRHGTVRRAIGLSASALAAFSMPFLAGILVFFLAGTKLTVAAPIAVGLGLGVWSLAGWRDRAQRAGFRRAVALGSLSALTWWVFAAVPVAPTYHQQRAGTRYWHLETGSTIGYERTTSRRLHPRQNPVVVLHGGPGIAERAALRSFVDSLRMTDRDFYIYDEVGAGASSRLSPSEYSLKRDVADLEAIRHQLGADRLTLVGHSYGSVLAAAYASEYPERVDRMILASPGPLSSRDRSTNNLFARLSVREGFNLFTHALQPRMAMTYALSVMNPTRARGVIGDNQADAMSDSLVLRASPALYCKAPSNIPASQTGNYRMQASPWPLSRAVSASLTQQLVRLRTPTLILKGSCDYLSWSSAAEYRRLIRTSHLCYLSGAGHNLLEEQQTEAKVLVTNFLQGGAGCLHEDSLMRPASYSGAEDPR